MPGINPQGFAPLGPPSLCPSEPRGALSPQGAHPGQHLAPPLVLRDDYSLLLLAAAERIAAAAAVLLLLAARLLQLQPRTAHSSPPNTATRGRTHTLACNSKS